MLSASRRFPPSPPVNSLQTTVAPGDRAQAAKSCFTTASGQIMVAQLSRKPHRKEQMPENQQAVLEYEAAGASDQGRIRKSNEDAYGLSLRNSEATCNFVVCDGMGGAAAGEVASRLAVDAMLRAM